MPRPSRLPLLPLLAALLALAAAGPGGGSLASLRQAWRGATAGARAERALPERLTAFDIPDAWTAHPPEGFRWKHAREFVWQGVYYDIAARQRLADGWRCWAVADHVDRALAGAARAHAERWARGLAGPAPGSRCAAAPPPAPRVAWGAAAAFTARPGQGVPLRPPRTAGPPSAEGPAPPTPPPRGRVA